MRRTKDSIFYPLVEASRKGDIYTVMELLETKIEVNNETIQAALCAAMTFDQSDVVSALLQDENFKPTDETRNTLHGACEQGKKDIVKRILSRSQSMDENFIFKFRKLLALLGDDKANATASVVIEDWK